MTTEQFKRLLGDDALLERWVLSLDRVASEGVFGEVSEGYVLAQPKRAGRGYWTQAQIDAWLAKKTKEGYEAATLADGLKYVAENPQAHKNAPIIFWASVSADGRVAYLDGRGVWIHDLGSCRHDDGWSERCRFLLRKVR